jgi:beta-lactamase class A
MLWKLLGLAAVGTLWGAGLQEELEARAKRGPGKVFLYAKHLKTGKTIGLQAEEKVRTASTIKLPILVEVFAGAAEGKWKLDDEIEMRKQDVVSGSGVMRELTAGTKLKIRDVANLMIVVSDNTGTNVILERITADRVNARMDALGLPATRSMRKVRGDGTQLAPAQGWSKAGLLEENKKFGLGSSTSIEMVKLLEMLEDGKLEGSNAMLEILKRQQDNTGMQRKLGKYTIASKSGALDHLRSDVGIVYAKSGPIAMAITVEDIPGIDYGPDNAGLLVLADLAEMIVNAWER